MTRSTGVLLAALLILGASAPAARAVTLGGRSSSQALWFADEAGDDHVVLAEVLRFSLRGLDNADTLRVNGYARFHADLDEGGIDTRLYHLFLDKRGLLKGTDVRVGRHFFYYGAGSAVVDGARVDARVLKNVALSLSGGRHVLFDLEGEATKNGDTAWGVQAGLAGIPRVYCDLSAFVSFDEGDLARQLFGLAAGYRHDRYGEVYTQLRYDYLSDVMGEIQLGARTSLIDRLTLNAEYFRHIPTFDASSIYVVFAVEEFQEALLRADYALSRKVDLVGELRHEWYGGGDDANALEAGVRFRPRDAASLYGAAIWRAGAGGDLLGFELSGDAAVRKDVVAAAGVQYDVFQRELMADDGPAVKVWLGGRARITRAASVDARVEDTVSDRYDKDIRARLALNWDF